MTDDTNRIEQHDTAKTSRVVRRDADGAVIDRPAANLDIGSLLADSPEPQVARMEARRG